MKKFSARTKQVATIGAVGVMIAFGSGQATAEDGKGLGTAEADQAYSLGHSIGTQVKGTLPDVEQSSLVRGFDDAIHSREAALGADEMDRAIFAFETKRAEAAQIAAAAAAAANAEAGDAYRERFATEPGVVTLDNGLLYKVIEPGAGDPPETGANVTIHYRGTLVDGTELDDSYSRGEPITIPLERALPGWTAALERMPEGARWQVVIPPSLAYGEVGANGFIGPNTTLIFELERVAS